MQLYKWEVWSLEKIGSLLWHVKPLSGSVSDSRSHLVHYCADTLLTEILSTLMFEQTNQKNCQTKHDCNCQII